MSHSEPKSVRATNFFRLLRLHNSLASYMRDAALPASNETLHVDERLRKLVIDYKPAIVSLRKKQNV